MFNLGAREGDVCRASDTTQGLLFLSPDPVGSLGDLTRTLIIPEPSAGVQAVGRAASVTALPPEYAPGGYAENMPAREPAAAAPWPAVYTPWREPGKVHAGSGAQAVPARSCRSPASRVVTYSSTTGCRVKLPGCCPCSIRLRCRSLSTASSSSPEGLGI